MWIETTMTITVSEKAVNLPARIRRQAGIKTGDQLEVKVSGGVITMTPRLPKADDEYTPEQRRIIDARLDQAEKGRTHGPFTIAGATRFLKAELKVRDKNQKAR